MVNLKQVDVIMAEVGEIEDEVFKRRKAAEVKEQVGYDRPQDRKHTEELDLQPFDLLPFRR